MDATTGDVTDLLHAWAEEDPTALDRLVPLVFDELRSLARAHFSREPGHHTLQPTALVSELFLRFLGRRQVQWQSRAQFFRAASDLMRCILVDYARRRHAAKRGGGVANVNLDDAPTLAEMRRVDFETLYDAIDTLDRERRELVYLRFFFGFTHEEIAGYLELSAHTVKKRWLGTKARLHRELRRADREARQEIAGETAP